MVVTDPIADLLTRVRNAIASRHDSVQMPASKVKLAIANILLEEGYVKDVQFVKEEGDPQGVIKIELKYGAKYERVITNLTRVSKPGLRKFVNCEDLPKVLNGLGIAILSTDKGIMTDKKARAAGIGGEVLAYVW